MWTAINLVALGTNPFMTAVHQNMFHAPLEAKNKRIILLFKTLFYLHNINQTTESQALFCYCKGIRMTYKTFTL